MGENSANFSTLASQRRSPSFPARAPCPQPRNKSPLILRATDGKLEHDPLTGEFPIDFSIGVEAEIDAAALLLVQDDLEHLTAILAGAGALADDFDRVDDVVEDGVMDGGQSARVGPFLRLRRSRSIAAFGPREDAARSEEEDVAVREFLLEFARQAVLWEGEGGSC